MISPRIIALTLCLHTSISFTNNDSVVSALRIGSYVTSALIVMPNLLNFTYSNDTIRGVSLDKNIVKVAAGIALLTQDPAVSIELIVRGLEL